MLFLFVFFVAILSFYFIYLGRLCFKQENTFMKNIPSVPGLPILGNALDLNDTKKILNSLHHYRQTYGDIVQIKVGPFFTGVMIADYNLLEFVFNHKHTITKSEIGYKFLRPWLGTGLLTSSGEKWKKHRKMLTPAFHFQILKEFIHIFDSASDILVKKLKNETENKKNIDIYPFITLCALDIICESAMGTKVNAQENEESEYIRSIKLMSKIIIERSVSPIKMYDLLYPLTKDFYLERKALNVLHGYSKSIIRKRQSEVNNRTTKNTVKRKRAFLDLLLEASMDGNKLTFDEIREEVDTFLFEGHDTTSAGISFTIFSLANNLDVQKKAVEEQKLLFGDEKNPSVTYEHLQDMKYLEIVIKEALRLYPSVPFYARKSTEDIIYGDQLIPKGTEMMLFAQGIHKNPKYFPDPEKFYPERFENIDGKLPYAYIPFSAGPRNCIGQKFAMLEMKSTISKILRHFDLFPSDPKHELQLVAETILKSSNGIRIGFKIKE